MPRPPFWTATSVVLSALSAIATTDFKLYRAIAPIPLEGTMMLTKVATISLCIMAITEGTARASEMPFYPVEQWCDQVARSAGARSEMIYGGCISQEQSAYDSLKSRWSTLPIATQSWCDSVARSSGAGSYMILKGCVEQEINAGQANSRRQFQR